MLQMLQVEHHNSLLKVLASCHWSQQMLHTQSVTGHSLLQVLQVTACYTCNAVVQAHPVAAAVASGVPCLSGHEPAGYRRHASTKQDSCRGHDKVPGCAQDCGRQLGRELLPSWPDAAHHAQAQRHEVQHSPLQCASSSCLRAVAAWVLLRAGHALVPLSPKILLRAPGEPQDTVAASRLAREHCCRLYVSLKAMLQFSKKRPEALLQASGWPQCTAGSRLVPRYCRADAAKHSVQSVPCRQS